MRAWLIGRRLWSPSAVLRTERISQAFVKPWAIDLNRNWGSQQEERRPESMRPSLAWKVPNLKRLLISGLKGFMRGKAGLEEISDDSTFAVHACSLQNFIETVTVFLEAFRFSDQERNLSTGWKLDVLYEKYCEYADVVASHGQLKVAERYLDLLPTNYPAATVARDRVKEASGKGATTTQARKSQQPAPAGYGTRHHQATSSPYQPQQPATAAAGLPIPTHRRR